MNVVIEFIIENEGEVKLNIFMFVLRGKWDIFGCRNIEVEKGIVNMIWVIYKNRWEGYEVL